MNRVLGIGLLTLLNLACQPDTSDSPSPKDLFVKLYGNNEFEVAADFIVKEDGTFVILGTTTSPFFTASEDKSRVNDQDADFYLVFTDAEGNFTNELAIDDGSKGDQVATDILQLENGNLILSGYTYIDEIIGKNSNGELLSQTLMRGLLIMTDPDGKVLDTYISKKSDYNIDLTNQKEILKENKRFEKSDFYTEAYRTYFTPTVWVEEIINNVIQTSDGNIVFIGNTNDADINKNSFDSTTFDPSDIWVVKTSPKDLDSLIKDIKIGFLTGDNGVEIFERPDGSLFLLGYGPVIADNPNKALLAILNKDLFVEGFVSFPTENDLSYEVKDGVLLSNGGLAVTGTSTSKNNEERVFLLTTTPGGFEVSFKVLGSEGSLDDQRLLAGNHRGEGVIEMNNGNLAVIGTALAEDNNQKGDQILFFITSGFGELLSPEEGYLEKAFGGNLDDSGKAIMQLPDGRFIMLGTIDFEGNSKMIGLIKTNSRGELLR